MRKSLAQSFTLVELLIVMGVLAVLVVTILVSLNPAEAGRKSRDIKRMKDLTTLCSIIAQFIQDGKSPPTTPYYMISDGILSLSQPCNNNWTGLNLCDYTKIVSADPLTKSSGNWNMKAVCGGPISNPTICTMPARYYLKVNGSDYKAAVFQESKSNINNVMNDNGRYDYLAECASDMQMVFGN